LLSSGSLKPVTTIVDGFDNLPAAVAGLYRGDVSWALGPVNAVDQRSNISFRYYSTGSPFEYENIRFLYVRKRLIEDEGLRSKNSRKGAKSTTQQENAVGEPAGQ